MASAPASASAPGPTPGHRPSTDPPPARGSADKDKPRGLRKFWVETVKPLVVLFAVILVLRSSVIDWNDVPSGSMRPTIQEGDRILVNKLAYGFHTPFNGPKLDIPFTGLSFDNPLSFGPSFLYAAPQRGDIVTFWNPTPPRMTPAALNQDPDQADADGLMDNTSSGIRMVKRVMGLPGETVQVANGRLRIWDRDGKPVPVRYQDVADPPLLVDELPQPGGRTVRMPLEAVLETVAEPGRPEQVQVHHFAQFWTHRSHFRDTPKITLADPPGRHDDEYFLFGDNRDNSKDSRYYAQHGIAVRGAQITGEALFVAVSFDGSWLNPRFGRWFAGFDPDAPTGGAEGSGP